MIPELSLWHRASSHFLNLNFYICRMSMVIGTISQNCENHNEATWGKSLGSALNPWSFLSSSLFHAWRSRLGSRACSLLSKGQGRACLEPRFLISTWNTPSLCLPCDLSTLVRFMTSSCFHPFHFHFRSQLAFLPSTTTTPNTPASWLFPGFGRRLGHY